jgi:hypothetical protein
VSNAVLLVRWYFPELGYFADFSYTVHVINLAGSFKESEMDHGDEKRNTGAAMVRSTPVGVKRGVIFELYWAFLRLCKT